MGVKFSGFPTPTEGSIELHQGHILIQFGLDERIFRGKEELLLLEDFVIAGASGGVTEKRDLHSHVVSFDGAGKFEPGFRVSLVGHQGVGNFLKGVEGGRLIPQPRLFPRGLGLVILAH